MSLKNLSIAIFALILTGCALTPPQSEPQEIPANLATPCQPLQHLNDGTGGAVLKWSLAAAKQYADCQSRHKRLVEAWPKPPK